MASLTAAEALATSRRVVIKIGSALLVEKGALRQAWLEGLVADVAALRANGQDVVLVSSGSIALGRGILGLPGTALPLEQSQAAASVGQIHLAKAYAAALAANGITAAQVLVTLEDSENRRRYLNSRATLETLIGLGAVPVVNENDTVATDEIRFGDNDRLAAQVAALAGADLCVLLSDIDGLYTAMPGSAGAERLDIIPAITPEIEAMAGDAGSALAKGGMKTKIMAARIATQAGAHLIITEGGDLRPLSRLQNGGAASLFPAQASPSAARKQWISGMVARGSVAVDDGAVAALLKGKSLLPAGMVGVTGEFGRGDPVAITDAGGGLVARGLTRYTSQEAKALKGAQSADISRILGHPGRAALIHRDDMVMIATNEGE